MHHTNQSFNDIFKSSYDKQLIYKADYTGWYCTFDERFWTEKDVETDSAPTANVPSNASVSTTIFSRWGSIRIA